MDPHGALPDHYWELLEQYRMELVLEALSVVGNRDDAEDVVQETFCEAVKNPEKLRSADSLRAMLQSINRCNAMDRLRNRRRQETKVERKGRFDPSKSATTGGFSGLVVADFVANAIETLPARMRAVVVLHYFEHRTYKEIAELLKLPAGTVGRLLYEASKLLYGKLELHVDGKKDPNRESH